MVGRKGILRCGVVWLVAAGLLFLAAGSAGAGWIWRDGRWVWEEDRAVESPPPDTAPAGEKSEPIAPSRSPSPEPAAEPARERSPEPEAEPDAEEPGVEETAEPRLPWYKRWFGRGKAKPGPEQASPPAPEDESFPPAEPSRADRPWYQRWKRAPAPDADRALFEKGKAALEAGRHRSAAGTLKQLIKKYPTSVYREEAMWVRAEALFAQKEYYKAFEQYESLITQYAGSPRYADALRREMEIAELYFGPARRRVLGIPMLSGEMEAVEILRRAYEHQPTGRLAAACVLRIADYYWGKGRWEEAEDYYDKYCREFPNGQSVRHAELRRAECAIERCRGPRYDTDSLKLAQDRLEQYRRKYPEAAREQGVDAKIAALRDERAQAVYEVAAYYARAGDALAAAYYAERVEREFPGSPWAERGRELLDKTAMREGGAPEKEQSVEGSEAERAGPPSDS